MECSTCGKDNPDNAQFCGLCGANIISSEASIGTELPMVGFGEAISRGFGNYFRFSGRSTRAEYWWWVLFTVVASIVLYVVGQMVGVMGNLLSRLFELAVLVPSAALGARRLHDINRSGWWLLGYLGYILLVLPGLLMHILLIIWACKRGDEGPNQYGPDPRQATT